MPDHEIEGGSVPRPSASIDRTARDLRGSSSDDAYLQRFIGNILEIISVQLAAVTVEFHEQCDETGMRPAIVYVDGAAFRPAVDHPSQRGHRPDEHRSHRAMPVPDRTSCAVSDPPDTGLRRTRRVSRSVAPADQATMADGAARQVARGAHDRLEVPVFVGVEAVGALVVWLGEARSSSAAQVGLVEALAGQLGLALRESHLARRHEDAAIASERLRIASVIHDTLAQSFLAIILQLRGLRRRLRTDGSALQHWERAMATAQLGLSEAHRSVMALRPLDIESGGIVFALRQLAARTSVPGLLRCDCETDDDLPAVPADAQEALWRIAQEALGNALRHADAQAVHIELRYADHELLLRITDDGCGIRDEGTGFGMSTMRARTEALGGRFSFGNRPQGGAVVSVSIPVHSSV